MAPLYKGNDHIGCPKKNATLFWLLITFDLFEILVL